MAQITFVDGDVLTASQLNTYCAGEGGAWTGGYTPTLSQGASTDIAKTVNNSSYARYGRTIIWSFRVTATAAGTSGSAVTLTLPVTAASTAVFGSAFYEDTGTQLYPCAVVGASTTTINFLVSSLNGIGVTPTLAVASGDIIAGTIIYEAAS